MKNPWIKWIVGLTSVVSFASLIGYFQQPDQKYINNEIVNTEAQVSEPKENGQSYIVLTQQLNWDETWFDDPSYLINSQIITLDDNATEFDEALLANNFLTENKTIIASEGKKKLNEPKKTTTRSS